MAKIVVALNILFLLTLKYFSPLFQVRHIFVLWFDEFNGNIWKSRFHQEVVFSLAEIETKFIVKSVKKKYELNQALPSQTTKEVRNSYVLQTIST